MAAETITTAVEKRNEQKTPRAMVAAYMTDFATVLPTHIKPETWVRLAQGALRKGKPWKDANNKPDGRTELEVAATNNPGVFLASLLDAARLGLEPGTEQYYLTPRKVKGKLEILGIVGYQGYIELMYRAGAISSVVAEVVHANDEFRYRPGRDELPDHEIDWDSSDRGELRLAYAYARMKDGATSRVVVLNKADIERIKKSSQGSDSEYSPWVQHEAAMWLKSAVRQLAKWVPTSAEYIREQIRAARDIAAAADERPFTAPSIPDDVIDIHDADIIDEPSDEEPSAPVARAITEPQLKKLHVLLGKCHVGDADKHATVATLIGRQLESTKDLTLDEGRTVIDLLERCATSDNPAAALDHVLANLAEQES